MVATWRHQVSAAAPRAGSMNEDNVLTFRDFRYAWLAAVLALVASLAYVFNPEPGTPGGDTWVGRSRPTH